MEVEIKTEPGRQEPKIVILAGEESEELRRLAESLSKLTVGPVPVSRGDEKLLLPQREFLRFYHLHDTGWHGKGLRVPAVCEKNQGYPEWGKEERP